MKYLLTITLASTHLCAFAQTISTGLPAEPTRAAAPTAGTGAYAARAAVSVARSVASLKSYRDTIPPVQIRFSVVDGKAAQEMEEDLTVMGVLIDQAIDQPQTAMGINMVLTSSSVRAMYVEGSGALYMLKVSFPIHGPAEDQEKQEEKPASSEWEKAREAVKGIARPYEASGGSGPAFDPAQVQALKNVLINAMKNGANFRQLKPDEHLSVAIFGQPAPAHVYVQQQNADNAAEKKARSVVTWSSSGRSEPGTVMTLRARKADIDAFAKGALDLEAFTAKVSMTTYVGGGHDITSVNSWVRGGGGGSLRLY